MSIVNKFHIIDSIKQEQDHTSRASACIIEHTRNAQESLVVQGQGLGTSRKTLWMDDVSVVNRFHIIDSIKQEQDHLLTSARASVCMIEHTRNAQESLVL